MSSRKSAEPRSETGRAASRDSDPVDGPSMHARGGFRGKAQDGAPPGAGRGDGLVVLLLVIAVGLSALADRPPAVAVASQAGASRPATLDVNVAPWYQWTLLDGVGEHRARQIVERRERLGSFRSPGDLQSVPGLSRQWLQRVGDRLILQGRTLQEWLDAPPQQPGGSPLDGGGR